MQGWLEVFGVTLGHSELLWEDVPMLGGIQVALGDPGLLWEDVGMLRGIQVALRDSELLLEESGTLGSIRVCSGGFGVALGGCGDSPGARGSSGVTQGCSGLERRSQRPQGRAELRPPEGWGGGAGRGGAAAPRLRRGAARAMESGGALNGSAAAGRFAAAGTAALGALMALLIAVTVAGNALVMLAFVADSSLRTQNNFFLLNLAISDFLVGKVPPPAELRARRAPARQQLGGGAGSGERAGPPGAAPCTDTRGVPSGTPAPAPRHPPAAQGPLPTPPAGCGALEGAGLASRGAAGNAGRPPIPGPTDSSGYRCLLHSPVRALCADGEMDLREKSLQTLAGS